MQEQHALNKEFGIPDELCFVKGPDGIVLAVIDNRYASASVSLLGAHVLSFTPKGQDPVLWMSPMNNHEVGKAIYGGIPLCFPWFANHPTDEQKPMHGFAQYSFWKVTKTESLSDGRTKILLELNSDKSTTILWPHSFFVSLTVTVGKDLSVEVCIKNTDIVSVDFSDALHSYFKVGNISDVSVSGLDGTEYLDKTDNFTRKSQKGDIQITGHTDRIYLDTEAACIIRDKSLGREISVKKSGSRTTVVWNPWFTCKNIPDMTSQSYQDMICVETVNTANDRVTLEPGAQHKFSTNISLRKI